MSLYNITNNNIGETKISDLFVRDLTQFVNDEDVSVVDGDAASDDSGDNAGVSNENFTDFLECMVVDTYSKGLEDTSFIKEEIVSPVNLQIASSITDGLTVDTYNPLSYEALPKFEVDEERLIDPKDLDGLSDDEVAELEKAARLAESQKIIDDMIKTKEKEAQEIIKKAEESANLIRETAVFAADKIKDDSYVKGKAQGVADGYEEGMKSAKEDIQKAIDEELEKIRNTFSGLLESVTESKKLIEERYIDSLTQLSISTAEKVIKVSLQSSGEVIKGMIVSAIEDLQKTEWIKIYVSRYDFEMLKQIDYDLIDALSGVSDDVKIVVMEEEPEGTAIIETVEQVIDISANTQMENVKDIIDNAI